MRIDAPSITGSFVVNNATLPYISGLATVSGNTFTGNQVINGTIVATGTTLVSGSAQVSYTGITNIPSGIISGSAQLPSGVVSGSAQVTTFGFGTTGSNTFQGSQTVNGSLVVTGSLTAQQFIVSSSVTYLTESFASGSHKFGDSSDDNHNFTGSLLLNGSIGIGVAPTTQFNIFTSSVSTQNVMTEFYNGEYTSGSKNFIRVRNGINVGSTMSSYFGQGQDRNTYIVSNDFTRNDIVISGDNGKVAIGTTPTGSVADQLYISGSGAILRLKSALTYTDLAFQNSVATNFISADSASLRFYTGGGSVSNVTLTISTGSVGIGTLIPVVPLHVAGSGGVVRIGDTSNNIRIGNDIGGTYLEQYGTSAATSVLRFQSSKSANATDYTTVTIDPYSGLNVAKSGTGGNNVFASGVPIQVVYGAAAVSSGAQGGGYSMGTPCNGDTPTYNQGLEIASVSFTPKKSNSLILIQTNNVVMWENSNVSDHFYLFATNATDGTVLVKAGQYLQNFGSGAQNGGIICLNGVASSWGTSTKTISFRIGTTGGNGAYYQWNPYYNVSGFSSSTVGNFTYVITEIGQ